MSSPSGRSGGSTRTATPTATRSAQRPAGRLTPTAAPGDGDPRRVKLTMSRIDPFSVMKISFLLSVALGIASVIVVVALWLMLNSMGVFSVISDTISSFQQASATDSRFSLVEFLSLGRVVSLTIVFGVINMILLTAIATITAYIYNICAALVGGTQVTLTDD